VRNGAGSRRLFVRPAAVLFNVAACGALPQFVLTMRAANKLQPELI